MVIASPGLQTWPHVGWVMALSRETTEVTATAMRDKMEEKRIVVEGCSVNEWVGI